MDEANQDQVLVIENFIGGKFVKSDKHLDSFNPANGEVWARIPDSGIAEVDAAVESARNAFAKYCTDNNIISHALTLYLIFP